MARRISRPVPARPGPRRADRPRRAEPIQPDQLTGRDAAGNIEPIPGSAPRFPRTTTVPLPPGRNPRDADPDAGAPAGRGDHPGPHRRRRRRGPRRATAGRPRADRQRRLQRGRRAPGSPTAPARSAVTDGRLCTTVAGGLANPWDAGIGQDGVPLIAGAEYTLGFDVSATPGAARQGRAAARQRPLHHVRERGRHAPTGTAQRVEQTFTVPDDNPERPARSSRSAAPPPTQTLCLDDVSLRGGEPPAPYEPDTGPRVRVNQVGYLPGGPKNATVVTEATEALPWQLRSAAGAVVASGTHHPARRRRRLRAERADRRLLRLPHAGHRLHAHRRRRDQPPVRHLRRPLRPAALRLAAVLLRPAQRHRHRRRPDRRRVRPPRRPPRRRPQPGRHRRALPAGRLRLLAGRARRLVRRRRPRQVRGQRRHRHLPAAEHLRADQDRGDRRRRRGARRRHAAGARARQRACRTSSTRPAGSWSSCCACRCRPASRSPAWPTTRSTTRTGPACRSPRTTTRSRASCTRRRPPPPSTWPPPPPSAPGCSPRTTRRSPPAAAPPRRRRTPRPRPTRRCYAEPDRRHRRRRVRRQQRHRRVLLGGGRAVPHHRRRRPT